MSFVTLDNERLDSMATLHIEIPDQKAAALKAYAQARGLSVEQWLTQLVDQAAPVAPLDTPDEDDRPLSAMFGEIWADMPDEVRAKLPSDGADQHDHYIYGTPKRAV